MGAQVVDSQAVDRRRTNLSAGLAHLRLLALVVVGFYLVALLFGPSGPQRWREFGIQVPGYVLIALHATGWAVLDRSRRSWLVPVSGWMWAMALGNALANGLEWGQTPSVTSASTAVYTMGFPFGLAAVIRLNRGSWRPSSTDQMVEAAITTLAIASLFVSFVIPRALESTKGDLTAAVATLVYPLFDLMLVMLLARALSFSAWGSLRMSGWMMVGVGLYTSVDSIYALGVSDGTWEGGHPIDAVWMLGSVAVGLMAPLAPRTEGSGLLWQVGTVAAPLLAAVTGMSVLMMGHWVAVPTGGLVLAGSCLLAALSRFATMNIEMQELLESHRLARTDDLTGLGNRRRMYEALDDALADPHQSYAVLMADLDRFKEINDRFGHAAGDDVLRGVADCMRTVMPEDSVLVRLGGDEFAVVAPSTAERTGIDLAWAWADAVAKLPTPAGPIVGTSIGVVDTRDERRPNRSELLRRADVAMYCAKREGLIVHRSDPSMVRLTGGDFVSGPADNVSITRF